MEPTDSVKRLDQKGLLDGVHGSRGQKYTDNPAKYRFIRNRIVPLGLKRIMI